MSDRRGYSRDGSRDSRHSSSTNYPQNYQSSHRSSHDSSRSNRWENSSRDYHHSEENSKKNEHTPKTENSTVIRVSYDIVNCLSARGNAKVGELQDKSGAQIKVLHEDDNWVDVGVQISGEKEQIKLAEKMIKELNSSTSNSNTNSSTPYQSSSKGDGTSLDDWTFNAADSGMKKPKWENERQLDSERWQKPSFEPPRRQNHVESESRHPQPSANTLIVKVPSGSVGRIIGRGGAKINELQDQTGARIKILKDDDNGTEASIQITGDVEKQKEAERLIKELVSTSSFPGSGFSTNSAQPHTVPDQSDVAFVDWGAVIRDSKEASIRRWANSPKICKNFYIEDPEVAVMSREEVEKFRLTHNNITISHYKSDDTRPIPNPVMTFAQAFAHYPELLEAVQNQQFKDPSPIQCQAWPVLLKGHDLIGIAQTGTGKTLAFLLPALIHIEGQPVTRSERQGPSVLIMAPTRELAQQIEREVAKFPWKGIKCLCVYGGGDRRQQIGAVSAGVEIVVATPGRLYDLMQAGALKTSSVSYVVLDEADRMLDLGFEPQIKKILIDVRPDRQIIMTSATWPEGIRRIANEYMDNPLQVCVGTLDLAACHSVTQHVEILDEEDKRQRLLDFIRHLDPNDKAIVFVGRKLVADQVASELSLIGISCQCIHGDREQIDREQALADLRNGDVRLLIATDVASRGIDIKDITHILNYDFPRHAEEYVHRVGRTGRAGRTGIAISFMTREDWSKASDLIDILKEANQEVPPELIRMAERFAAWKERKDEERQRNAADMGGGGGFRGRGGGGGRGGRRGDRDGGFGGGFGSRRGGFGRDFM
uniref:RNA helicase n=1 Tax=Daphnia magna TaxID=35525 RepID=A0A0N8BTU9_9CRUS